MPPNLRCVVAQGWRSTGSRRNFSSSRGSNGETEGFFEGLKSLYENPGSKGSTEFKLKLARRGTAVCMGYVLGFLTIKKPSWEVARTLEEQRRRYEELHSS
ncbi:unnamed protein product [Microthlaspi erraticum]|uniref:Uncharacterized protein n=1 Tax=Microthlaspi erraticum TaxID=1685480 RepID=A0A6D2JNZ2_9BRAS|nr:unnamed protein product [Microthlaspi erraticum]